MLAMLGEVEACVKRMEDLGLAEGEELDVWRRVFERTSVSKRHVDSGTIYLALAPEDKRKDCFRNLGFSPDVGLFSEWARENGLDPFAKHMSWTLNSRCQYRFGEGDFFVMSPGIIEGFQCAHLCRFIGLLVRVGPQAVAGLLDMYQAELDSISMDVVREEKEIVADADAYESPVEPMVEASYLLALKPDVREKAFGQLGLRVTLMELVSAEFPFQETAALERLRCDIMVDPPDVLCVGDDVLVGVAEEGRFVLHRNREHGLSFYDVVQTLCVYEQRVRLLRQKYDCVDYGLGNIVDLAGYHYDLLAAEPLLDVELDPGPSSVVQLGQDGVEHSCLLYGFCSAVPFGLRERLGELMGTESSFSTLVHFVGGRFTEWSCECEDRFRRGFRSVVFIRYKGGGVDRYVDAVWYGLEHVGEVSTYVCVKRVILDFNAPGLGTLGLLSCKEVEMNALPGVIMRDKTARGRVSFVKFQYDANRFRGDMQVWPDGSEGKMAEETVRGCFGHVHV